MTIERGVRSPDQACGLFLLESLNCIVILLEFPIPSKGQRCNLILHIQQLAIFHTRLIWMLHDVLLQDLLMFGNLLYFSFGFFPCHTQLYASGRPTA
jgi:hypothetical protein